MKDIYLKVINLFGLEAVVSLINFINIIIIARYLNLEDFALWGVLVVLLRIGEVIARPKTDLASVYVSGTRKWDISNILSHSLLLSLLVGLLVSLILFVSEPLLKLFLFNKYQNYDPSFIKLIIGTLLLTNIFISYKYIFLAKQQALNYGLVELVRSLLVAVIIILTISREIFDIYAILWATIFANIIAILASMIIFHSKEKFTFVNQKDLYYEIISKGMQFYIIGIFSQINISLPILFASRLFTPEITGFLIVSKNFIELIITRFISPFSSIAYSNLSHEKNADTRQALSIDLSGKCLLLIGASSIVLFFTGDRLIQLFYGEKFVDDSILWIVRILLPGVSIFFYSIVLTQLNYSIGKFSNLKYFYLFAVLFQLVSVFFLSSNINIILLSSLYSISITIAGFLMIMSFILLTKIKFNDFFYMTMISMKDAVSYTISLVSFIRPKSNQSK